MPEHRPRRIGSRVRAGASAHSEPLDARAVEDLRFIRQTMERSAAFTAVPGWGMALAGATALVTAWFASRSAYDGRWLTIWIADAVVAIGIAMATIHRKAGEHGLPWTSGPGRKVAISFAPPFVAAVVLTASMFAAHLGYLLPGTWLLLYGASVVTAGAYSVAIVPVMGICFMVAGGSTLAGPILFPVLASGLWANWAMAAGFGGLHILFGIWIARNHGG